MPQLTWAEEDIKRGTQVVPGWYLAEILNAEWKSSKDGESQNFVVDWKVLNHEGGDAKFSGVPIRVYMSEKAPGFWKSFLASFGVQMNPKGGSMEIEGERYKGKKAYIMVQNDTFDGRPTNKVADYRPASPEKK